MLNLINNPILLPHQTEILRLFFASSYGQKFFLTGGTALSAFYLNHRQSLDLDFFTHQDFDSLQLKLIVEEISQKTDSQIFTKVTANTYQEIYLQNQEENWTQRLDFVREQPVHFGELKNIEGIVVDSLENIATNKICSILGRLEPKDFVDLYVILTQSDFSFETLFTLAKQKDLGLSEFSLANSLIQVEKINNWPPLTISLDLQAMIKFYLNLSQKLFLSIKPE